MSNIRLTLESCIQKLEKWIEEHEYKSYEPFDGLLSIFRPLTFNNLFLERILMQVNRQSPINIRPLLGIKPVESTKGRGYMAWGYLTLYKNSKDNSYKKKALNCLNWLIENKSPKFQDFSWANHFDFASRGGKYTRDESIIVWTALIGQVFLDAFELINNEKYLSVVESVTNWILKLPKEKTDSGICLSYLADHMSSIHNSNMLGAAFLARASKYISNNSLREMAYEAMLYSCSRQNDDGSWYYAERADMHWIDNFHTGYNLDSLKCYIESTGDQTFLKNLRNGFKFYTDNFFEKNGQPKYYHDRAYPIDSQCASQSIDTLSNFMEFEKYSYDLAMKVAQWTIENMQGEDGHFYYRIYPLNIKAKTPMFHWAQATTYKALTNLYSKCN